MKEKFKKLIVFITNTVVSLLIGIFISLYLLQTPMIVIENSQLDTEQELKKVKLNIENKGSSIAKDIIIRTVVGQVNNDKMEIAHEEIEANLVQLNPGEASIYTTKGFVLEEKQSVIYISISSHDNNVFREFIRKFIGNPYERNKWLLYRPEVDNIKLFYFSRFQNARYKKVITDVMDKLRDMTPTISKDIDEMAI